MFQKFIKHTVSKRSNVLTVKQIKLKYNAMNGNIHTDTHSHISKKKNNFFLHNKSLCMYFASIS